jgi:hypothetical protein
VHCVYIVRIYREISDRINRTIHNQHRRVWQLNSAGHRKRKFDKI